MTQASTSAIAATPIRSPRSSPSQANQEASQQLMAPSRNAMSMSILVAVVVAAASVAVATAEAPCDSDCRLKAATKAFAAAPPTEKAAAVQILGNKTDGAVSSAESAHEAAKLATRCLDDCNKLCGAGKKDLACSTRCENICRVEVESLSFAADMYAESSATEKKAVIQAIDKQAAQPSDKIEAIAATCIGECRKFCDNGKKDPACVTTCDDGCRARAVSVAFALATPDKKETIKKEIAAASAPN